MDFTKNGSDAVTPSNAEEFQIAQATPKASPGKSSRAKAPAVPQTPELDGGRVVRIEPDPDGRVVLPADVDLQKITVSGADLVVELPDGSFLVIVGAAKEPVELVVGGVVFPESTVAALLDGEAIDPAAGAPTSSGGNFEVAAGDIGDGFSLTDLLPPTALAFTSPTDEEIFVGLEDRDPEVGVTTPENPIPVFNAVTAVQESGLPARGNEPAGSNASAPTETTSGAIVYQDGNGPSVIALNGAPITTVGQTFQNPLGVLTITSINPGVIGYSFTLTDNATTDTAINYSVLITDTADGGQALATLVINIIDDAPSANPDTDTIAAGSFVVATGNVITDASAGDVGDSDNGADVQGADGAAITRVASVNTPANVDTTVEAGNLVVSGQYGVLTLNATTGAYSYARNANAGGGVTDTFNYTLTDGDGDTASTTLTISIADAPVTVTGLIPQAMGGDVSVNEANLLDGSAPNAGALTQGGLFMVTAPDGVTSLTVGGVAVIAGGVFTAANITTPLGNTVSITGYNPTTGIVTYTFALTDNEAHSAGAGLNGLFESLPVILTDRDGDVFNDNLVARIVDDMPTARDDADAIASGSFAPVTGNLITDASAGDIGDTDTGADTVGADGAAVTRVSSINAPANADTTVEGGSLVVTGQYGVLTVNAATGAYTYARNAGSGGGVVDTFNYTLTDADGDPSSANLVITIADGGVTITNLTPREQGGDVVVNEASLSDGSAPNAAALAPAGTFTISAPDGVAGLTVGGVAVITNGVFAAQTITTPLGNMLAITGYNAATGVVSYTYTLTGNEAHGSGDLTETFAVVLTDFDGDTANDSLVARIVDDLPSANNDADAVAAGSFAPATGNLITDASAGDLGDADDGADVVGADGATVTRIASTNVPANVDTTVDAGNLVVAGQYGILTVVAATGASSYVRNPASTGGVTDTFSYTLTDADGDAASANLVIAIGDAPVTITNLTPAGEGGDVVVNEANLADGSAPNTAALIGAGAFTLAAADGVASLTVGGVAVITNGVFAAQTIATPLGNILSITAYNAATGVVSYTYTLTDNEAHASGDLTETFAVVLTDSDGDVANDSLVARIVDDVPAATNDADAIATGSFAPAAGNVITDASVGDLGDTDTGADVVGADGAAVTRIASVNVPANTDTLFEGGNLVVAGQYGVLTIAANGDYTYVRNAGSPGGVIDTFSYTLTDGDGDVASANLVISVGDAPVIVTDLTPTGLGGDVVVSEANLADGSAPNAAALARAGTFTVGAPDGIASLTVGGVAVITNGVFTAQVIVSPLGNTLSVTGYDAATGVVSYTYTLTDNEAHASGDLTETFAVVLTDSDGDVANESLVARIVDDVPLANADADAIAAGSFAPATGDVITDASAGDVGDSDNGADVVGADGAAVTRAASVNVPANVDVTFEAGSLVVAGQYGVLTMAANGDYSYARNPAVGGGGVDTFNYTITDADGDVASANLVISVADAPVTLTDLTPAGLGGDVVVNEANLADGSAPNATALSPVGTFTVSSPDGVASLTVGGVAVITNGVFAAQTITTPLGNTLAITAYDAATGVVTYSYTLTDNEAHATGDLTETFAVVLTDNDGDVANDALVARIVDDAPVAADDADALAAGSFAPATGNLITDASAGDLGDTDTGADVAGADGATVTRIASTNLPANVDTTVDAGNLVVAGQYGVLTVDAATGAYSYVRNANAGGGRVDSFSYTLTDADGDVASANLVITIEDDGVTVTNLTPQAGGGDVVVFENDLADGSSPNAAALIGVGSLTVSAPDGVASLTIGGVAVITGGVFTAQTFATPLGNTLAVTGYDAASGVVSYTYTLTDNEAHASVQGGNDLFETLAIVLTDFDGDVTGGDLVARIVDDVPTAAADAANTTEGALLTVAADGVLANDIDGADGAAVVVGVAIGSNVAAPVAGGLGAPIETAYGFLTLNADGSYAYQSKPDSIGANVIDHFVYTIRDTDGDLSTTTLDITISAGGPAVVDEDGVAVFEAALDLTQDGADLAPGTVAGTAPVSTGETVTGSLADNVTGGAGAMTYAIVGSSTGSYGEISVNAATGAFIYTLTKPYTTSPAANNGAAAELDRDTFTFRATDANGNTATAIVKIDIIDDVPQVSLTGSAIPTLQVDETNLALNASGNFASLFTVNHGADGQGAPTAYGLSVAVNGAASGLTDTASGQTVLLFMNSGVVEGRTAGSNALVFTVSTNASGVVTLDQVRAVVHANTADHNEATSALTASLIRLTATATDGDGDIAAQTVNIGGALSFRDDGPSVSLTGSAIPTLVVDETNLALNASGNFADLFSVGHGADGQGASTAYGLSVSTNGAATGLTDTATGQSVLLFMNSGVVEGRTSGSNALVFTVSTNASGVVTLDQVRSVVHANTSDHNDASTALAASLIRLTMTATDKDGDTAAQTVNIGGALSFRDDGPSISLTGSAAPSLQVDETILATNATGSFASQFVVSYGADGSAAANPLVYSLAVKSAGVASGLVDTATGQNIVLSVNGGVVEGRTASSNALAFTVQVASNGQVTLDQVRAVVHPNTANHNEPVSLSAADLVTLTARAVDRDGDSAAQTVSIGDKLTFLDDGPTAAGEAHTVTEVMQDFNVAFVLDFSGSISDSELNVQLDAVRAAGQALFANTNGDVSIRVIAFSSDSAPFGPFTTSAAFTTAINGLNPMEAGGARPGSIGNSTDFTDAIQQTMVSFVPNAGANNQIFFLSDGNPNEQTGTGALSNATATAWNTFVDSNNISVTAIGVGDGINNTALANIDVDANSAPIAVASFDDLIDTLLASVAPPPVSGNVLSNDSFGVDGGRLQSITIGAVTYTWNGANLIGLSSGGSVAGNTLTNIATPSGGKLTFSFATGAYSYTGPANIPATSVENFGYVVRDNDGDTASANIAITLKSLPTIAPSTISVSEEGLTGGNADTIGTPDTTNAKAASGAVTLGFDVTPTVTLGTPSTALTSGGVAVTWSGAGTQTLVGSVGGTEVVRVVIDNAGAYTVTLSKAVDHPNATIEDALNLVVPINATDGSTPLTTTLTVSIEDDRPTLGAVGSVAATNNPGDPVDFGALPISEGGDLPGKAIITGAPPAGLTSGGLAISYATNAATGVLTAYTGADASIVANQVFKVTPNVGSDTYTFDLMKALDGAVVASSIGSSTSFGAGPQPAHTLITSGGVAVAVVSGWTGSGGSTLSSANGSTGGWGVSNNNLDNGEMLRFDFDTLQDFDGAGPYAPGAFDGPSIAYAKFQFPNDSWSDDARYTVYYSDGTNSGLLNHDLGGSNGAQLTLNAPAGKFISYVQISNPGSGNYKVTLAEVGTQSTVVNQNLTFNVAVTDADGDSVNGTINVNVGTANVPPVVLDLDGDGLEFTAAHAALFDFNGDGVADTTAWVSADDGFLSFDENGNGLVDSAREIAFAGRLGGGMSDLEAVRQEFDANGDGQLSAAGDQFAKFGVWQDANGDGVAQAGEVMSLADLGIASIDLVTDGQAYTAANDQVSVLGEATFTRADGTTGRLGDVMFASDPLRADEQQRLSAINATLSGLVAAGLVVAIDPDAVQTPTAANQGSPVEEPVNVVDHAVVVDTEHLPAPASVDVEQAAATVEDPSASNADADAAPTPDEADAAQQHGYASEDLVSYEDTDLGEPSSAVAFLDSSDLTLVAAVPTVSVEASVEPDVAAVLTDALGADAGVDAILTAVVGEDASPAAVMVEVNETSIAGLVTDDGGIAFAVGFSDHLAAQEAVNYNG